jgi:hypothetical protein
LRISSDVEFLDVDGTKGLRVFILDISQSHLPTDLTPPPPPEQTWIETGDVNIYWVH